MEEKAEPQRHGEKSGEARSFYLTQAQVDGMMRHALDDFPCECCGLVGGRRNKAGTIYPTKNVARSPRTSYEAAPEDLFKAQRAMRERGEDLIAIYHSHPQATDAVPSRTDVRLAFYPNAVYVILAVGDAGNVCVRGFRLYEAVGTWEPVPLVVVD